MRISLRHGWIFLAQGILTCLFSPAAFPQQPRSPEMPAPPPMRFVARDERSRLTASKDPKARLRATIELAEDHLTRAEDFTSQRKFDQASEELGSYMGLIDDALAFAASMNHDKGSTRDLYRHMEISLRAHIPRLAVMSRTTPAAYVGNIKAAEEYIKDARAEALDSFYGHSVLREDANEQKKPPGSKDFPEGNKRP